MRSWPALPVAFLLLSALPAAPCLAGVTVFFNPGQVATLVESGTTWDTITCAGYRFVYTRDKLFTGGGGEPIGRPVRVAWPDGIEAQYVTAGPNPSKAQITVSRVDGGVFDLTSFTAKLLANAGAGRAIEIVPLLNSEEPFNDPFYFDVSGVYGNEFSYDTSPNPLGSTAPLVGFDTYRIALTLDYALTALTLTDPSTTGVPATTLPVMALSPNPARNRVEIRSGTPACGPASVFSTAGSRLCSLPFDASGRARWGLCDDQGRPVAGGVYYIRIESADHRFETMRLVVLR